MKKALLSIALMSILALFPGCGGVAWNAHSTSTQTQLSQANFTVVETGVEGIAEQSILFPSAAFGSFIFAPGVPWGIVLSGDNYLVKAAMNNLRQKAQLKGKSRAFVNVTQQLEYSPFLFLYARVRFSITADVVEFK